MSLAAKDRLIAALDVPSVQQARALVDCLRDVVGMFKVGSQLFAVAGPSIVREIVKTGSKVFLDLKFHDIPNTVASAAVEVTRLGVSIFNVHALGGGEMMRRTTDAVSEVAASTGLERPSVIAVTVLTSADAITLQQVGINSQPEEEVLRLALLAEVSGLDGVVASPLEVQSIRRAIVRRDFLVVTPGVRPLGAAPDDQRRVMTPAEAIKAGADYIVVGRPITEAHDPVRSANQIVHELERALA